MMSYINDLGENDKPSLSDLTVKTVMLLALSRPSRSADLANLDIQFRNYTPEGVVFAPSALTKQSRAQKPVADSSTITRWIKNLLAKAGVNMEIFKAHSVRGASTSASRTYQRPTHQPPNCITNSLKED